MRVNSLMVLGLSAIALACGLTASAQGEGEIWVQRGVPAAFTPGQPLEVTITLNANLGTQPITAVGVSEDVPPGWTYNGMRAVSGDQPAITPQPGAGGRIEFAWITTPRFPTTFAYTMTTSESSDGVQTIGGQVEYRENGPAIVRASEVSEIAGPENNGGTVNNPVPTGGTNTPRPSRPATYTPRPGPMPAEDTAPPVDSTPTPQPATVPANNPTNNAATPGTVSANTPAQGTAAASTAGTATAANAAATAANANAARPGATAANPNAAANATAAMAGVRVVPDQRELDAINNKLAMPNGKAANAAKPVQPAAPVKVANAAAPAPGAKPASAEPQAAPAAPIAKTASPTAPPAQPGAPADGGLKLAKAVAPMAAPAAGIVPAVSAASVHPAKSAAPGFFKRVIMRFGGMGKREFAQTGVSLLVFAIVGGLAWYGWRIAYASDPRKPHPAK